ncbi:MAG TPA: hypothetical protein VGG72_27785 [Bryobacteraceae bacterium]|jgi:hypothetical protein
MRNVVLLFLSLALTSARAESADVYLMNLASGTSQNPEAAMMPMLMRPAGSWLLSLMGQGFLSDTQQRSPRSGDKLYSTNWIMASAGHSLGGGSLLLETMLSLEPATVTDRRYPELFQTGETAYGVPLVDAQHPHNFLMGLGVHYAHKLGESAMAHFYYAPVGDPALGPVAFPHRTSAQELPQAPIGHHWEDSTHISDNVATVGLQYRWARLEASGFNGTEPGENRWGFDWGLALIKLIAYSPVANFPAMNSYSARLSVLPGKNWDAQVSAGRLSHPESEQPGDVVRTTASLAYTRRLSGGMWASTLAWGRNHETLTGRNLNAYLLETLYQAGHKNFLTCRIELVDKDELFEDQPALQASLNRSVGSTFRVQAYTAGYTRDIAHLRDAETGLGINVTAYAIPAAIQPYYGVHPWGANVFLRVRIKH